PCISDCCHLLYCRLSGLVRYRIPLLAPYTTLFRSQRFEIACFDINAINSTVCGPVDWVVEGRNIKNPSSVAGYITHPSIGMRHRDRKSTRLNSSHVSISYAVFCLKKKNQATQKNDH